MPKARPKPRTGTKQRMRDSAITLLRERGAAGVTIDAVLAHSGAPRGSVYHHFPGGRQELILEAARDAGEFISGIVESSAAEGDPRATLRRFVRFWKHTLAETDYLAGCPIVALALDSQHSDETAAELVRELFARWQHSLREQLRANGFDKQRAHRLATLTVAAIEGAVLLCRAHREDTALDDVAAELGALLPDQPVGSKG